MAAAVGAHVLAADIYNTFIQKLLKNEVNNGGRVANQRKCLFILLGVSCIHHGKNTLSKT